MNRIATLWSGRGIFGEERLDAALRSSVMESLARLFDTIGERGSEFAAGTDDAGICVASATRCPE
jgi:hypothetical protein